MKKRFRAEREFGLIVGTVLVLLSTWWLYRGKFITAAEVLLPVGAALISLGLLLPRSLVIPNRIWMLLAEGLSFVSTNIILAILYFLVVTPIGVVKRLSGWDPLGRRAASENSYWKPYPERQRNSRHYEKMY
ncbi:MAG: SxtJ family membrane protein [Pyrinomonadaceae bacterium]